MKMSTKKSNESDDRLISLIIPDIGEGVEEVVLTELLVGLDETIEKGQTVAIISSDKVDMDIFAEESGKIIEIGFKAGETLKVGETLMLIKSVVAKEESTITKEDLEKNAEKNGKELDTDFGERYTSPINRKLLREHNISLSDFKKSGYISRDKIMEQVDSVKSEKMEMVEDSVKETVCNRNQEYEEVEFSAFRAAIAKHMDDSLRRSAQLTSFFKLDITELVKLKKNLKESSFPKLTFTPILIRCFAKALQHFDKLCAHVIERDGKLFYRKYKDLNVNLAVDTPNGLLTPILRDCDTPNFSSFLQNYKTMLNKIKERKYGKSDLKLGAVTYSNTGSVGLDFDTPILNYPQSVLIATGVSRKELMVSEREEGGFNIRDYLHVSVTYDHRLLDGADIGRFAKRMREIASFDHKELTSTLF
jgi:pyruvate/2-oxoglutarate dehydrogenase complex dihydrolipoamide acyltransferase (E2) component